MTYNHVVVWIDHVDAHVIHFNRDAKDNEKITTHSTRPHLHVKAGTLGSGRAPENAHYFDDIAQAISDSQEILVVGPGFEKLVFMKYLLKHHPVVAEKVLSVETVDHPTDNQLVAFAKKYFLKEDQMR